MPQLTRRGLIGAIAGAAAGGAIFLLDDDDSYHPVDAPVGSVGYKGERTTHDPDVDASLRADYEQVAPGTFEIGLLWTNLTDRTVSAETPIRWGRPPGPPEDDTLDGTVATVSVELDAGEVERQTVEVTASKPGTHFYTPVETDRISADGVVIEVVPDD